MNNIFEFNLQNYNGPLDILLELVKDKKMDILTIDLAELAGEYLNMISSLKETNLDLASEYLVMAATLLQLKSRILLESPDDKVVLEQDKDAFLRKLAEYQQFKLMAQKLRDKEEQRKKIFIKKQEDDSQFQRPLDETKLYGKSDPIKLIMILRKMFERTHAAQLRQTTIESANISPEERAMEIKVMLKEKADLSFEEVFNVPTMKHFVVTLVALLDLARLQYAKIHQNEQYGTISVTRGELYD